MLCYAEHRRGREHCPTAAGRPGDVDQISSVIPQAIRLFTYMGDDRLRGPELYSENLAHFYDHRVGDNHKAEGSSVARPLLPPSPTVSSTTSPNGSISCQVCGDTSSGLHFGVYTCEGCKCFYRRSIREGARYICSKSGNCCITADTRNTCRYCRFYRCLALGMSPEGIKLGRRPKLEPRQPIMNYKGVCRQELAVSGLKMKLKRAARAKMYQETWNHPYVVTGWHANSVHSGNVAWTDNSMDDNFALKTQDNAFASCSEVVPPDAQRTFNSETECVRTETPAPMLNLKREACGSSVIVKQEPDLDDNAAADEGVETLLQSPPVSPTLPEVIYGAAQALAFANMYRQDDSDAYGQNESDSSNGFSTSETGLS
ncbi:uncharacterized protein [Ptychodera flava]|uniref:uncharacterized protein isoform X2 n=1 Tax=Ptychodera flava TaxID=63121 RepID=UPI00396A87C3